MTQPKILVVEDESIVAMELENRLTKQGYEVVGTAADAETALQKAATMRPDIIMMDIRLQGPQDGIEAAEEIRARFAMPVIYLTAHVDEATLQRARLTEPFGYLLKPFREHELHAAIEMALYKHRMEEQVREKQHFIEQITQTVPDIVYVVDLKQQRNVFVNREMFATLGYSIADIRQKNQSMNDVVHSEDRALIEQASQQVVAAADGEIVEVEYRMRHTDGTWRWLNARNTVFKRNANGKVEQFLGVAQDITERKRAEEALRKSEAQNRALLEAVPDLLFRLDQVGVFLDYHAPKESVLYAPPEMFLGKAVRDVLPPQVAELAMNAIGQALRSKEMVMYEYALTIGDEQQFFENRTVPLSEGEVLAVVRDITEQKQAEEEQAKLEQQLRQSQKMESIGQLAGGIAHDFNNLLTVIQGYSNLMQAQISSEDPLLEDLHYIQRASERAATLTRQLLAFSRQQVLAPTILDLNDLVTNLHKMLGRLIGEDIQLAIVLQPGLWPVTADPGQIEQVIMNLAINARDAMPTGGMLTIETHNTYLDDSYLKTHPESPAGDCVMLAVTDTGHGMDEATRGRIFEPFFTTKALNQGTGLGLATVHGIVKQSGGEILVYSEPGHGATFKIYLPTSEPAARNQAASETKPVIQGGSETILLVEDEEMVRNLLKDALQAKGYTVLVASNGDEALSMFEQHQGPLDLLVTDVVMPHMSGRELAEQLMARHPQLKVLFMSGYTDDAVVRHGVLAAEVEFLSKPFSPDTLAAKVRAVLDQ